MPILDLPFPFPCRWPGVRSLVLLAGLAADAGTLTPDGLYTPPVVSLARIRVVRVEATALAARLPSGAAPAGTALAVIRPAAGLRLARAQSGQPGAGAREERLEPLAMDLAEAPAAEGDPLEPSPGDPADRVAWAPGWPGGGGSKDVWLVAVDDRVLAVSPEGRTGLLAQAAPGTAPAPRFTWLAARPQAGNGSGDPRAVLWDARGRAFWRLDPAGHLSPWVAVALRPSGRDAARTEGPAVLEGLALDRQGRAYALFRRGAGAGQVVRIEPDGTLALLAGAAPGAGPALAWSEGLTLAPDGRALFSLDPDPGGPRLVRIALADGAVTVRPLNLPPYRGTPRAIAFSRGRLVLAGVEPAAFFLVDPDTGGGRRIYRDALRSGDVPDGDRPLRPGPCYHSGRPRDRCGSLGTGFRGEFAADGQGRLAVLSGSRAGLLVLDWDRPGARTDGEGEGGAAGGHARGTEPAGSRTAR